MSSSGDAESVVVVVSNVSAAGEVATIGIKRPDGVTDTVLVTLDATGKGSNPYTATMDGIYTVASGTIPAETPSTDGTPRYAAASFSPSTPVTFTVSDILLPRTITVSVVPATPAPAA